MTVQEGFVMVSGGQISRQLGQENRGVEQVQDYLRWRTQSWIARLLINNKARLALLDRLTFGDFAIVFRQRELQDKALGSKDWLVSFHDESDFLGKMSRHAMGFAAT